jgi:hypothetical protein
MDISYQVEAVILREAINANEFEEAHVTEFGGLLRFAGLSLIALMSIWCFGAAFLGFSGYEPTNEMLGMMVGFLGLQFALGKFAHWVMPSTLYSRPFIRVMDPEYSFSVLTPLSTALATGLSDAGLVAGLLVSAAGLLLASGQIICVMGKEQLLLKNIDPAVCVSRRPKRTERTLT